jgi:glycosyltransferase 2 family protein
LKRRPVQLVLILALTVFLVWLFLRSANLHDVWHILKSVNIPWLLLAFGINFCALLFRTWRWQTIIDPKSPPAFYPTFFANAVGYMLSTVLPVRAADVARPALLARRTTIRFSGILGTVLTERVLDLSSLLILFVYFALRRWRQFTAVPDTAKLWRFIVVPATISSIAILIALAVFMVGTYFFRARMRRFHGWVAGIVPKRFRDAWMNFFDSFVQTLDLGHHVGATTKVLLCTAGIWFCLTAQFVCTVIALHIDLPFDASYFVTGTTTVGLALPTPGGIGGLHKICQFVLTRFYHLPIDISVAAAVLFHLVGTIPVVVTGLLLFAHEGLRWRDVTNA